MPIVDPPERRGCSGHPDFDLQCKQVKPFLTSSNLPWWIVPAGSHTRWLAGGESLPPGELRRQVLDPIFERLDANYKLLHGRAAAIRAHIERLTEKEPAILYEIRSWRRQGNGQKARIRTHGFVLTACDGDNYGLLYAWQFTYGKHSGKLVHYVARRLSNLSLVDKWRRFPVLPQALTA